MPLYDGLLVSKYPFTLETKVLSEARLLEFAGRKINGRETKGRILEHRYRKYFDIFVPLLSTRNPTPKKLQVPKRNEIELNELVNRSKTEDLSIHHTTPPQFFTQSSSPTRFRTRSY